jgi:hypothetical protein
MKSCQPIGAASKKITDIAAAFKSSKRRLLIVGGPGSGKTIAAYSLIEYLDKNEVRQIEGETGGVTGGVPLLVNLSAWEGQDNFEAFLVDYLCSSVGYQEPQRSVAEAFIASRQYSLILDGLDEMAPALRKYFAERLDEFVEGLPSEVAVVVTCRTREYEKLLDTRSAGLGLVQAVEILPLTDEQLDSAFVELTKRDKDWEAFLSQRQLKAYRRVRALLSNPLLLNLAVVGHLSPDQLLDWSTREQELEGLVIKTYLDHTLAAHRRYEPADARRYLSWIARYLNRAELSPFGLKTSDYAVFDLAGLTPPEPPKRFRVYEAIVYGLAIGLFSTLILSFDGIWVALTALVSVPFTVLSFAMGFALSSGVGLPLGSLLRLMRNWVRSRKRLILIVLILLVTSPITLILLFVLILNVIFNLTLPLGLITGLVSRWTYKKSALSTRLTFVWPSTRQRGRDFFRKASRRGVLGSTLGLILGLWIGWVIGDIALVTGGGIVFGIIYGVGFALFETRPGLIIYRTLTEAGSRSLTTALTFALITALVLGLASGIALGLVALVLGPLAPTSELHTVSPLVLFLTGMGVGMAVGLLIGGMVVMNNGGWFVLLQKVAHRRLARAGNLPSPPYDFLKWGIETQIFRRVGGGVRFRHNLIQQHLASTSAEAEE